MASSSPLTGVILVDCAKANVENGIKVAAQQCGYGEDVAAFETALKQACADMNIDLKEFSQLAIDKRVNHRDGFEVYPDTATDL
jgi:pyruvate-formate lyase-activating enzyme